MADFITAETTKGEVVEINLDNVNYIKGNTIVFVNGLSLLVRGVQKTSVKRPGTRKRRTVKEAEPVEQKEKGDAQ